MKEKKRGMKLKTLNKEEQKVEAIEEEVDVKKLLKMKGKRKIAVTVRELIQKHRKGVISKVNFPKTLLVMLQLTQHYELLL